LSWLIADQVLTAQMRTLVNIESEALERQSITVTEAVRQNLKQLHGVTQVTAEDDVVLRSLARHDVKVIPVAMSVAQRKVIWINNPIFAASNLRLAKIAASLGVEVAYIMDANGNCIASSNAAQADAFVGANFAQRDYFKMALEGKTGYQYAVGKVSNIPGLYFSSPILHDGHIIGVAAAKLNVPNLSHWINQSEAYISDKYGVIILAGDKRLEMRALPNSSIASLSEVERVARYKRSDFLPLVKVQWQAPALPQLKNYGHESVPLLIAEQHIDEEDIGIHVEKYLPVVANFSQERLRLFILLSLLGLAVIAGIRFRILFIGKRNALEVMQREDLERLKMLADRVPGMLFEYELRADGSSCFPFSSDAIRDIYRASPEEVRNDASKVFSIIHPDDLQGVADSIQDSARNLTLWSYEYRVRFEDGIEHWLLGNASPSWLENGSVLWHGFITDITARRAMEREIQDANENMQRLLNTMAEGVFTVDMQGNCNFVNRAFLQLLGYTSPEIVIGLNLHELIHHSRKDGRPLSILECEWMQVIQTLQPVNIKDEVFWRKDGTAIPVEYWAHPIVKDDVVVGVIATFIDITLRVLIQEEQAKMTGQFLQQNQLLLEYREHIKEEESTARDFIKQFSALDKIKDPLVQFMYKPAENFSGDMIAFARTPDNRLHVLLADSAGHGLTAALAVIPITQPFYQMTAKGFDIPAIAQEMNRRVRDYLPLPRYVACVLLSLDTEAQAIQVWNGGCPAVLMLSQDGKTVLHRFQSKHLPMGVVKPEKFSGLVEHLNYEGKPCQLLTCTDGATEMMSGQGGLDGYDELLSKTHKLERATLYDGMVEVLGRAIKDKEQLDDIAMVLLQCLSENELGTNDLKIDSIANVLQQETTPSGLVQKGESVWEYRMTLTSPQLKRLDVVPFLVGVTSQIDGEKTNSKVFLVLSELFNNALDHGVLKLSSNLKHKAEDMEAYYEEREKRMASLVQGKVEMHLEKFRSDAGYLMKIHFKDSGEGFDFSELNEASFANGQRKRHGRGIPLLAGTCNALQYFGNGSEVIAYLELPTP